MEFVHNTAFYKIAYKVTKKNPYMQIILHKLGEMGGLSQECNGNGTVINASLTTHAQNTNG